MKDGESDDIDITLEELAECNPAVDLSAFDFKLPNVISWNSRALFAASADLARGKLRVLADLQGQGDILCIQETHQGRCAESAILSSQWQRFSSPMNPRAGGVMVLVRKAWLAAGHWRATSSELVQGRAMLVNLSSARSRTKLVVICVHVEKPEEGSPEDVLRTVGVYVAEARLRNVLVLGCGDFNFDLDADRVGADGNLLPRRGASLGRLWHHYFHDCTVPLIDSPTHLHGDGTLAKIDFHFLTLAPASVAALGGHCFVRGQQHAPPGGSDHWPVCLVWRSAELDVNDLPVPRWVQLEPLWQTILAQMVEESFDRVERWQSGWLKLQMCAAGAFAAYKRETQGIPSDNVAANFLASGKALRLWWGGQRDGLRKLLHLAPHWGIAASTPWSQLRGRLEILHGNLTEQQLLERLERAKQESEEEEDESERRNAIAKSSVLSKLFAQWRKRRCSPPCVTLVSSSTMHEGELLSAPELVAGEIERHWRSVFSHPVDVDEDSFRAISAHAGEMEWPDVQYSEEECAAVLAVLARKKSAPGPDG
eukprot:1923827-Amphidinium_carterae.1